MIRRPPFYSAEPRVCLGCGHYDAGRCGHPHDTRPTTDDGWCAWWKPFGLKYTFTQMPAPVRGRRFVLDRAPPARAPAPLREPAPPSRPLPVLSEEQLVRLEQLPAWQQEIILREYQA